MEELIEKVSEDVVRITPPPIAVEVSISELEAKLAEQEAELDNLLHRDDVVRTQAAIAELQALISKYKAVVK